MPVREQENVTWLCVDNRTAIPVRLYASDIPLGIADPGISNLRVPTAFAESTLVIRELAVGYHETPYSVRWTNYPQWAFTWDYSYERSILSLQPAERCL